MKRQEKVDAVAELKDTLGQVASLVVTDFRGLTVDNVNKLRKEIRAAECEYRVIKNTLVKIAIAGTDMEELSPLFKGPSAIAYSFNDPVAPAKVIDTFASKQKKFAVKGGFLDGQTLDEAGVAGLAKMKGKDELRGDLLALFQAPAQTMVRLLAAGPTNFLYLLNAQKEELGGDEA